MRSRGSSLVCAVFRGLIVAGSLAACDSVVAPSVAPSVVTKGPRGSYQFTAVKPARRSRGVEDALLNLESRIPGFGGMFTLPDGNVVVYVAPNTPSAVAQREVRAYLGKSTDQLTGTRPLKIIERPGKFGFGSLVAWTEAIAEGSTRDNNIAFLDADESTNRVRVMVRTEAARGRLPALARRLKIPISAIAAEVDDFIVTKTNTLTMYNRPAAAGLQIMALNSATWNSSTARFEANVQACTMGFNIVVGGTGYMVTASHCTNSYGGQLNRRWYQPSIVFNPFTGQDMINTPYLIGATAINPAWRTSGCTYPNATFCRETDGMLVKWADQSAFAQNVYETSVVGTGNNPGNNIIGNEIQAWNNEPGWQQSVGRSVMKTGGISGSTVGTLLSTCGYTPPDTLDGISIECANVAQLEQRPGDSGAPVFRPFEVPYTGDRRFIEGIASMRGSVASNPGVSHMICSPWWALLQELGVSTSAPPPPPPPFSGSIWGPTAISPNITYQWSFSPQYGTAPYTYRWYVDGMEAGTDSYIDWSFPASSSHTISATATDATGRQTSHAISVVVDSGTCAPDDPGCGQTRIGRKLPTQRKPPVPSGSTGIGRP